MTEKDLNKFAKKVADEVIDALEKKQKEWDDELIEELESDPDIEKVELRGWSIGLSDRQFLQQQLVDLQGQLDTAIEEENYDIAAEIRNKIIEIKSKISKL
jgi:excinuclease UvrABC helicase subunit UvrB